MNSGHITISDVAQVAGVSTATVSRVLNGVESVDPALVEKVNAAIAATGYVPNGAGRALRRQRSDVWAVIVPDIQNSFFTSVVSALEDTAAEHGYSVMLCNTDERLDREQAYIRTAISHRMSGVVIAVASALKSDLSPLERAGIPTVLIDRAMAGSGHDSVMLDNVAAGRKAANHLARMGYRRVAVISGSPEVSTTEDRLVGARQVLEELGLSLPEELIRRTDLRADGAEIAVRALLSGANRPDAIFATNGPLTTGAYRAIQGLGLAMPGDIALVGVDDEVWTRMVHPDVSVIQQPVRDFGRYAGQILAARAASPGGAAATPPQRIVLDPVLMPRASSVPGQ